MARNTVAFSLTLPSDTYRVILEDADECGVTVREVVRDLCEVHAHLLRMAKEDKDREAGQQ